MYFVVNAYLKDMAGNCLIHQSARKDGYQDIGDAEEATRRINDRLAKKGLVRQAAVVKR